MASIAIDRTDGLSSSTAIKGPCRVATTANIALNGTQTIDGVAVVVDDRVLVKSQTAPSENGIYVADTGPWRRAKDFEKSRDVTKGTRVTVTDGTTNGGREYRLTTANPISVGTSNITIAETLSSDSGSNAAAAAASATAAAGSASSASTSASNAASSASAASTSAGAAATSASSASTSAATATTQASNAAGSASAAFTSATNAGNSATAAAGSASAASTSASNASTSASTATTQASNAAASATNAANSATAAANLVAALPYNFSTTTTDADPGAGVFSLNNAAPGSATAAYIGNTDADGVSATGVLDTWDDSTNTVRGVLTIRSKTDATIRHTYNVTGSVVDGTGYRKITLAYVGGSGTLTNGAAHWLIFDRAGDAGAVVPTDIREKLTAARTYYVGFDMGAVTMSIASPAVVTKSAHGLVAGSRCSFSIKPNIKTCTISAASPAVVTMANTFAAGQPVVFSSTSRLPTGITAGTTYYVIATGLSGSSFQISATPGGAAVNTTPPTVTITNASPAVVTDTAHGLSVGDPVTFATTGALPTGLTAGTQYFVKVVPNGNSYQVSATPEGAAINTSSAGSGTHTRVQNGTQFCSETGALPTGVNAGQDYYVIATGLTANTFQFSATLGGAAVNTSGSTSGTISCKTGSDANTGLTNSVGGAFLTIQGAYNAISTRIDAAGQFVIISVADGAYTGGLDVSQAIVGTRTVYLRGNGANPANVTITATNAHGIFNQVAGFQVSTFGFTISTVTSGQGIWAFRGGLITLESGSMRFGTIASGGDHFLASQGGMIEIFTSYTIAGNAQNHWHCYGQSHILCQGATITLTGRPAFSGSFCGNAQSAAYVSGTTFTGLATGSRYLSHKNAIIDTGTLSDPTYLPGSVAGTFGNGGLYF